MSDSPNHVLAHTKRHHPRVVVKYHMVALHGINALL
jgi:hypothetical protein